MENMPIGSPTSIPTWLPLIWHSSVIETKKVLENQLTSSESWNEITPPFYTPEIKGSHKSPTTVLFDVDTGKISVRHCDMLKSTTLNVLARSQG
ncbi:hypothetical protein Tco_0072574 [Tanacetum coccineum]